MPRLLLMRHAKSSWSDPRLADHDRPLNARGRQAAPRMGRWLLERDVCPDLILSSTALRARSTAEAVAAVIDRGVRPITVPRLYHASPEEMVEVLAEVETDRRTVLLVAHNPGIEAFLTETTGRRESCPTGVIALIDFPGEWSDLHVSARGTCADVWRPRELPPEPDR